MFYETEKSEYFDMQKDLIYKWEHTHRKKNILHYNLRVQKHFSNRTGAHPSAGDAR